MFYNQTKDTVLTELKSSRHTGLTNKEARLRLEKQGPNEIQKDPPTPIWKIFIDSFKEPLVIILLLAI